MRQHGFTLIELIMTLLILGILAVYVLPKITNVSMASYTGAEELIQAIHYARQEAMDHTDTSGIGITIGANSFTFVGVASPVDIWQLQAPPGYVVNFNPNTFTITFDKRGVPTCSGGYNCATAPLPITVTADGNTTTVTFEPYTGLAHR